MYLKETPKSSPVRKSKKKLKPSTNISLNKAIHKGSDLYQTFNRFQPGQIKRVAHNRVIPGVVVELGELAGLIYRSDKWQPGHKRTFIHFMENPPRLVSNIEGTQLFIVGGNYRITSRGIEG